MRARHSVISPVHQLLGEPVKSMSADYWLSELLDDNDVHTLDDAAKMLSDARSLPRRLEPYEHRQQPLDPLPQSDNVAIVAGSTLDLSGSFDCIGPQCVRDRVDELFGRV